MYNEWDLQGAYALRQSGNGATRRTGDGLQNRPPRDGDIVVVKTRDAATYCKRYYEDGPDHVHLESFNPINPTKAIRLAKKDIKRIHVVVGVWFG